MVLREVWEKWCDEGQIDENKVELKGLKNETRGVTVDDGDKVYNEVIVGWEVQGAEEAAHNQVQ